MAPSSSDTQCLLLSNIELVDLFHICSSPQSLLSHKYPNETLIYHGYIGCAPMYPMVAISLCTLVTYCQIHRTYPYFSIQAQCKALCFLHEIPYWPYLCMQFLAAYDIYLKIIHSVDKHLRAPLNHNMPNWCLLNSCLACFYKLQDEPTLEFDWLVSIDGNNSLKHWDSAIYNTTACIDSCKACSNYWIGPMAVGQFKGEVKAQGDSSLDDWGDEPIKTNPGSLTCVSHWQNAGPKTHKKMFSVFHESGIFIAACCHHFILLACNMI
ncbi:hypothetical protein BDR06DRAFT_981977 [Suillus hirtellus]|nr:hypothetical protein BDR06DRAFT_981977 [Suillus hirtellus]